MWMRPAPKSQTISQAENGAVAASQKASKKEEATKTKPSWLCEATCGQEAKWVSCSTKAAKMDVGRANAV